MRDVSHWLEYKKLEMLVPAFLAQEVDGKTLLSLNEEDLKVKFHLPASTRKMFLAERNLLLSKTPKKKKVQKLQHQTKFWTEWGSSFS